jgi:hypothetical protein
MTDPKPFAIAAAAAILLATQVPALAQAVGKADRVEAEVTAEQPGSVRPLKAADYVLYRDALATGKAARLLATLEDGTQLTLGENARLTVDRFVYDPARGKGELALAVTKGAFRFVGGNIESKPGAVVSIRTPAATLGVRGTTVWGGQIDGGFGVLVQSGEVSVTARGGTVVLKAGQGTIVRAGRPDPVAPWGADRTRRALATIAFTGQN